MKIALIGLALIGSLLAGCRREEAAYEPMKLGRSPAEYQRAP